LLLTTLLLLVAAQVDITEAVEVEQVVYVLLLIQLAAGEV
jgi:hypothetical protein